MRPGYHVGGLLLHDPVKVIGELASLGFGTVAVRASAGWLDAGRDDFPVVWKRLSGAAERSEVRLIVDLDAPFLFDPHRSEPPGVVSDDDGDRSKVLEWLSRWAGEVGDGGWLTLASGRLSAGESLSMAIDSVADRWGRAAAIVDAAGATLAMRPVIGHAVGSVADFLTLTRWLDVQLAADVGQMILAGEFPVGDRLLRCLDRLRCVYVCDPGDGSGDQRIGHGEVATERIVTTLMRADYDGAAVYRVLGHETLGLLPAREAIASFESVG